MTTDPDMLASLVLKRLRPIGIGGTSITLMQPVGQNALLIKAEHDLPEGMLEVVKRQVQKAAGTDVAVRVADPSAPLEASQLIAAKAGYQLALIPALRAAGPRITTFKAAVEGTIWENASRISKIFKDGQRPTISFKVIKGLIPTGVAKQGTEWERLITGVVLEPEVADGTMTEESEADIYSAEEIFKGMSWWMEHAYGSYALHHVQQGGEPLTGRDVSLIENWQTRSDERLGDQIVKRGAWCQTNRVQKTEKGEKLWKSILGGQINSWSIGTQAMGVLEEAQGPVEDAGHGHGRNMFFQR